MYDWDFSWVFEHLGAYARGTLVTVQLAAGVITIGTLLGFPVALILRLPRPIVLPVRAFVEILRAIPDIVWIFFVYFFPFKLMFGASPPSPFACALIALSCVLALFSGVLIRSALDQVPRAQLLGAHSLGFTQPQIWRHVIIPSVVRQTLPGMVAFWIGMLKATSLASVIVVRDVVFIAKIGMAQNARALEAWLTVAVVYVALVLPAVAGLRRIEKMDWLQRQ